MQKVSSDYVESMKSIGRNHGYIRITLGIVNSEAQENIRVSDETELVYFSDTIVEQGLEVTQPYVTCEENWSKVDGSMYFLPAESEGNVYYENGLVSKDLNGAIVFDFGGEAYDVVGFTIDFGENYPVDFVISNGTDILEFENNDTRYFSTDRGLHNMSNLVILPTRMVNGDGRLRIYSLSMGVSNTFTNENTISYSETTYVSPIAETLPSTDVSFSVANYENYYNPDNPESVMAFFEVGQEVKVQFGYDTHDDGEIEWLPETVTHLKTWRATDSDASFTATDSFDNVQSTYYKGKYNSEGITLYDLAEEVFADAGIEDYTIDKVLNDIVVYNPLPPVPHTQALQIIANAGRCTLREDRTGKIFIEGTFIPDYSLTCNGETEYSRVANVGFNTPKRAYAIESQDFSLLSDDYMGYMGEVDLTQVGYTSSEISDGNGNFSTNPIVTLELETSYAPSGLNIQFRNVAPQEFTITTYLYGEQVDTFTVENPDYSYKFTDAFNEFDVMAIEFTKGHPNSRVTIDYIGFGSFADYTIERNQIKSSPVTTRIDKIKNIVVSSFNYKDSPDNIKSLVTTTITNATENNYTFHFSNPSYGFEVNVAEGTADTEIIESGCYEIIVRLSNIESTDVKLDIKGYEYDVDEQLINVTHNANGIEKSWSNPLISTVGHAELIESWLSDYYLGDVEYDITWRGDPRLDADDLINLELKTGKIANVRAYQNTLTFGGAWSGDIRAKTVYQSNSGAKTKIVPPTITSNLTYNGSEQTATVSPYDPAMVSVTGITGTNAGEYTATIHLIDSEHYKWSDGTFSDRYVTWTIKKQTLTVPNVTSNLTYTGSQQTATVSSYDSTKISVTGITGTNAGTYTATKSLRDTSNYAWSDNTTEAKTQDWTIGKATGYITVSKSRISLSIATQTDSLTVNSYSGASYSYSTSGSTSAINVSKSGDTFTFSDTTNTVGTVTLTLTTPATDNYNAYSRTITATYTAYSVPSWSTGTDAELAQAIQLHKDGVINLYNYWNVGDERDVQLSAISATPAQPAQTVTWVIMDQGGIEGDGLFVAGMKNCLTNTVDMWSQVSPDGWDISALREWANYATDSFKNALPSTFASLFILVQNTSERSGGVDYKYVGDYFALFAEKQLFGTNIRANPNYETTLSQFAYYAQDANRIKKKLGNSASSYSAYWQRSASTTAGNWCIVNTSGGSSYYANTSSGNFGIALFGVIG